MTCSTSIYSELARLEKERTALQEAYDGADWRAKEWCRLYSESQNKVATLIEALEQYGQHGMSCSFTNQFKRTRPKCSRCHGTGFIPSETCDECPDCQDACPVCGHVQSVPAPCDCGLAAALAVAREEVSK